MQGLLDFIKTPEGQGLLSGVFGYAANARRGTPINNLGRGGIAGLLGYSNAMEREQDAKQNEWLQQYRGLQMDQMRSEIEKNRQAEAERQRIDSLVRGAIGGFTPQQAIGMDASGPTQAKANMIGQPGQVDYRALYAQGVPMDKIQELVNLGNINKTKVKNIETINIDGKPVKVGIDEYGQQVAQIGMEWKPLERVDAGGYVGLYDPTDPTGGVRKLVDKTMSPEGRDASARGWATVRQGEQRLAMDRGQNAYTFNADLGGYVPKAPGGQFIPLENPPKSLKLTESEAKNSLYLGQMREASAALEGLNVGPVGVAMTSTPYTNWMVGDASQRAGQAQRQWAEAYLRAKTGAAATAGEVDNNVRTFFPVVGDSEATIKRKAEARKAAEMGMELPAGRGAEKIPTAPNNNSPKVPMVGQVVDGYKFKGGNPADPKNWEAAR